MPTSKISKLFLFVVFSTISLASCVRKKMNLSPYQLTEIILDHDCPLTTIGSSNLHITHWSLDTVYSYNYPNNNQNILTDTTLIQLGGTTTAFLAASIQNELKHKNLQLDETALTVPCNTGKSKNITFKELLLHTSGIPFYSPDENLKPIEAMLNYDSLLTKGCNEIKKGKYQYNLWNYRLLLEVLKSKSKNTNDLRNNSILYIDQIDEKVKAKMAKTSANNTQNVKKPTHIRDLFSSITGGVSTPLKLKSLLDSLSKEDLSQLPFVATQIGQSEIEAVPGWHRLPLKNDEFVYITNGKTHYFSSAVAYYPYTKTGVIVTANNMESLSCIAVNLLRNINNNWKRQPKHEKK